MNSIHRSIAILLLLPAAVVAVDGNERLKGMNNNNLRLSSIKHKFKRMLAKGGGGNGGGGGGDNNLHHHQIHVLYPILAMVGGVYPVTLSMVVIVILIKQIVVQWVQVWLLNGCLLNPVNVLN